MTIIVFLIDTSASMNQRVYSFGRPTLLDVAKGSVETFVKIRQRSPDSKGDRYMLLTFEEYPHNIRAGWKENLQTFTQELKNLQAFGMSNLGVAVKNTFDVLNVNRMQSGIDMYGQGRCPFFLEPSVVVCITDSGRLTGSNMVVTDELKIPRDSRVPGSELTRDSFRWDQRFFSLVLRLSGTPSGERDASGLVHADTSGIDKLCEITGGRSYAVTSHRVLLQCVESLVQKIQSGVVIHFEKIGPDPPPLPSDASQFGDEVIVDNIVDGAAGGGGGGAAVAAATSRCESPASGLALGSAVAGWHSCRRLILVPRSAQKGFPPGHWPIPESFWPEITAPTLVARSAHPSVRFSCSAREPMVVDNLPFDKYELEPSPLTQYILSRRQPSVCWQVFVCNSSKNGGTGHPFGYLKASTSLSCVNLFVLPYNYPALLPLIDELFKVHRLKPNKDWKVRFDTYIRTMPAYYAEPMRQALKRMGAPNLVPGTLENGLSVNVVSHLKRLKNQARLEHERMCAEVASRQQQQQQQQQVASVSAGGAAPAASSAEPPACIRVTPTALHKSGSPPSPAVPALVSGLGEARQRVALTATSNPALAERFGELSRQLAELPSVALLVRQRQLARHSLRNAFDIPRHQLLDQLLTMRANLLQSSRASVQLYHQDQVHDMPVGQMGNYQDYLRRMTPPLRELETTPVRQHMFGNPFKIDKRMMVDEADVDLLDKSMRGGAGGAGRGRAPLSDGSTARHARQRRPPPPSLPPPLPPATPSSAPAPAAATLAMPAVDLVQRHGVGALLDAKLGSLADIPPPAATAAAPLPPAPSPPPPVASADAVSQQLAVPLAREAGANGLSSPGSESGVDQDGNSSCCSDQPSVVSLTELEDEMELGEIVVPSTALCNSAIYSPVGVKSTSDQPPLVNGLASLPCPANVPHNTLSAAEMKSRRRLRLIIFRLVRRPGRNYTELLAAIDQFPGAASVRVQLLDDVIDEASRLRRRDLATVLRLRRRRACGDTAAVPVAGHANSNGDSARCNSWSLR